LAGPLLDEDQTMVAGCNVVCADSAQPCHDALAIGKNRKIAARGTSLPGSCSNLAAVLAPMTASAKAIGFPCSRSCSIGIIIGTPGAGRSCLRGCGVMATERSGQEAAGLGVLHRTCAAEEPDQLLYDTAAVTRAGLEAASVILCRWVLAVTGTTAPRSASRSHLTMRSPGGSISRSASTMAPSFRPPAPD